MTGTLATFAVAMWRLGCGSLADWDEALTAIRSANMANDLTFAARNGDGSPCLNKPPGYYWLASILIDVWGRTEFAVRLPSALFGAMGVLATYLGAREASRCHRTGCYAAALLLTCPHWWNVAREARLESATGTLMLCATTALLMWRDSKKAYWLVISTLLLASAALVKSPAPLLILPLILRRHAAHPMVLTAGGATVVLGLGWYGACSILHEEAFAHDYVGRQIVDRFSGELDGHSGGPLYYHKVLAKRSYVLYVTFVCAAFALARAPHRRRRSGPYLLIASVWMAGLTLMQTKIHWYVVPAYPFFAVVAGCALARRLSGIWPIVALCLAAGAFLWDARGYVACLDGGPQSKATAPAVARFLTPRTRVLAVDAEPQAYAFYLDHPVEKSWGARGAIQSLDAARSTHALVLTSPRMAKRLADLAASRWDVRIHDTPSDLVLCELALVD